MDNQRIHTDKGYQRFEKISGNTSNKLIVDQRLVDSYKRFYNATGTIDRGIGELWKVKTESGYEVLIPRHWEIPVLRSLGKDINGKDIKGYFDIPLSELPIGEPIMIYGKSSKEGISHGFNKACPINNSLATIITIIQARPDRFLAMDSQGKIKLELDTVKERGYFNINDLNSIRTFAGAVSEFINQKQLPLMKNLHYLAYKSHLGEMIYDLSWLLPHLKEVGFDINELYNTKSFDNLFNCSHLTFKKIMKFLIDNFFICSGTGKNVKFALFHESDELLKNLQLRFLDYRIMSSRHEVNDEYIKKSWRKNHLTSYLKHLKRKNLGKLSKQKFFVLQIKNSAIDKFVDLTTYPSDELSSLRALKSVRACHRAKNLFNRTVFWDRVESIQKASKGLIWRISVPNGRHIVLNGVVLKN